MGFSTGEGCWVVAPAGNDASGEGSRPELAIDCWATSGAATGLGHPVLARPRADSLRRVQRLTASSLGRHRLGAGMRRKCCVRPDGRRSDLGPPLTLIAPKAAGPLSATYRHVGFAPKSV